MTAFTDDAPLLPLNWMDIQLPKCQATQEAFTNPLMETFTEISAGDGTLRKSPSCTSHFGNPVRILGKNFGTSSSHRVPLIHRATTRQLRCSRDDRARYRYPSAPRAASLIPKSFNTRRRYTYYYTLAGAPNACPLFHNAAIDDSRRGYMHELISPPS